MKHIHLWRLRRRYRQLLRMIRTVRKSPSHRESANALMRDCGELRRAIKRAELAFAPIPVRPRR